MRRWRGLFLRIAIVFALIGAFFWNARQDDIAGLADVRDGDSITIDGVQVRLFGIDAPELDQQCRDKRGATYACGRLSQRHLARIAKGEVRCDPIETDRYGRTVAICHAGEVDLGAAMVSAGWARAYLSYSLRYATAETAAQDRRRGMWDGEFDDPWAYREDGYQDDLISFAWRWVREMLASAAPGWL